VMEESGIICFIYYTVGVGAGAYVAVAVEYVHIN
jgi:hypothetical protein